MNRKSFLKSLIAAVVMSPVVCRISDGLNLKLENGKHISSCQKIDDYFIVMSPFDPQQLLLSKDKWPCNRSFYHPGRSPQ